MIVKHFDEITKEDVAIAGGKGASLGEMTNANIPVPPGFVVLASVFDKFIEETGLNGKISAVLGKVDHNEMKQVNDTSKKIQKMISM